MSTMITNNPCDCHAAAFNKLPHDLMKTLVEFLPNKQIEKAFKKCGASCDAKISAIIKKVIYHVQVGDGAHFVLRVKTSKFGTHVIYMMIR